MLRHHSRLSFIKQLTFDRILLIQFMNVITMRHIFAIINDYFVLIPKNPLHGRVNSSSIVDIAYFLYHADMQFSFRYRKFYNRRMWYYLQTYSVYCKWGIKILELISSRSWLACKILNDCC